MKILKGLLLFAMTGLICFSFSFPAAAAVSGTENIANPRITDVSEYTYEGVSSTKLSTWDCIWFGNYWQEDTNGDGKADKKDSKLPVKWRVLYYDDTYEEALLLADKNLDRQPFDTHSVFKNWDESALRSYLNDTFLNDAFSEKEKTIIQSEIIENADNPTYGTDGGVDTEDRIFILSLDEVRNSQYGFQQRELRHESGTSEYWTDKDSSRVSQDTSYVSNIPSEDLSRRWWLRTPGQYGMYGSIILGNGAAVSDGNYKDSIIGVRPSLYVKLGENKSSWAYAGTVSSDGTINEREPFFRQDDDAAETEESSKENETTAASADLTAKRISIAGAVITPEKTSYTFTGSAIEPAVTVVLDGRALTKEKDYTAAYFNNIKVGTAAITVTGKGNYTGTASKKFSITEAPAKTEKSDDKKRTSRVAAVNNELKFDTDVWKFRNPPEMEFTLTTEDLQEYLASIRRTFRGKNAAAATEYFKDRILEDSQIDKKKEYAYYRSFTHDIPMNVKGGVCYGMSAAAILKKAGGINISGTLRSQNLTSANKNLIGYYYESQLLPNSYYAMAAFMMEKHTADQLAEIAEEASRVKSGGQPVLFSFMAEGWGSHAVVAYAAEAAGSTPFTSSVSGKTYDHRILIYDCNAVNWSPDCCLLYNKGKASWEIPYYYKNGVHSGNAKAKLKRSVNSKSEFEPGASYPSEKICELFSKMIELSGSDKVAVSDGGGFNAVLSGTGVKSSSERLTSFYPLDASSEAEQALTVLLPRQFSKLDFRPAGGGSGKIRIKYLVGGTYQNVLCDKSAKVSLKKDGTCVISGNAGDFTVKQTASDTTADNVTYIVTGTKDNSGEITVAPGKDGLSVKGNNIKNISVKSFNDTKSSENSYKIPEGTKSFETDKETASSVVRDADIAEDPLAVGKTVQYGNLKYKITKKGKEAACTGPVKKRSSSVSIPASVRIRGVNYKVTSISQKAFKGMASLKKLRLGKNVRIIGKNAFYGCKKLTRTEIPSEVKKIGAGAFQKCTKLKSVTIGKSVKTIGKKAFYGCKKLSVIKVKTAKLSKKTVGAKAFSKTAAKAKVKVPKKKLKAYKSLFVKKGLSKKASIKK